MVASHTCSVFYQCVRGLISIQLLFIPSSQRSQTLVMTPFPPKKQNRYVHLFQSDFALRSFVCCCVAIIFMIMVQPLAERNKEENVILAVFICIVSPKHITHNYICIYIYIYIFIAKMGLMRISLGFSFFSQRVSCSLAMLDVLLSHMSRNNDPIIIKKKKV